MKQIKKNYIFQVLLQVINFVLPLITVPYVARVLGPEIIGKVSYANSLAYYFYIIASLGLNVYASREVAYNQGDNSKVSSVFSSVVFLKTVILIPLAITYFAIDQSLIWLITFVNILYLFMDISWFFQGIQDFKILFLRNIIIKVLSVVLIFTLVKSTKDIYLYALIMYGSSLIGLLLLIPSLKKHIDLNVFYSNFFKLKNFNYLLLSLPLYIPQLGIDIYNSIDRSFIGYMVNETEVGYYEMSQKIVRVFLILITSLGTVLMPQIASMIKSGKEIKTTIDKSIGFTLFLTCGIVGLLFSLSDFIVTFFLGERFIQSINLLRILSFILLPISIGSIIGTQYMLPIGMDKQYKTPVLIGVTVNIILNIILISAISSNGAAIASVISEFSVMSTMIILTFKKINFLKLINKHNQFFIASALSIILSLIIKIYMSINIFNILFLSSIYVFVYLILSYSLSTFFKRQIKSIKFKH
ncbi:hypothetical protein AXE80_01075 [Wenyingzhuangia fucanilytica]|uniref:Uncharacterized protein n=1 Tax=Wenyingzhuangia fucanilytica TaxID=1790137 RepID=A0A1B1Y2J3_9FLAO|nr:oligosaccharide flippase family protein [Wenyingzhuangia fucanilytica]ANW94968.1 hypothetical protein AXE80_01075 [Wenyingzhuangia fucanilytica]